MKNGVFSIIKWRLSSMRSLMSIGYIRSVGSKRILVAASNPLFRDAISEVLTRERGVKLVGKVGSGWEVMQLTARFKPDIILIDFRLPGIDGLEATRAIKKQLAKVAIIILIDDDSKEYINAVTKSGALTYLVKSKMAQEIPVLLEKLEQTNLDPAHPRS
jgi:DNA-binding NarL/FixJ family response regulator